MPLIILCGIGTRKTRLIIAIAAEAMPNGWHVRLHHLVVSMPNYDAMRRVLLCGFCGAYWVWICKTE